MNRIKPLAIYLPQFHPIPENDAAWGEGFTEWINVKKAVPLFEGHYQPHIPHDSIGYYDLRDPEVLVKQAAMAREHGIYGFAFYHYWFNGKRLLNEPIDNMLEQGKPDFPFCLIWANENWTKRWDGKDKEIIIKQDYSFEDDREHIRFLCKNIFNDKRYITIDGKPIFIIYRTELFPDIKKTASIWREEAKRFGFNDLFLVRVENFLSGIDPIDIEFDAAMEFAPNGEDSVFTEFKNTKKGSTNVYDYNSTAFNIANKMITYKCFRTVFPSWDNTPRKKNDSVTFTNNLSLSFKYLLNSAIEYTNKNFADNERFLFLNAWNEWGEGCHLEPDKQNGYKNLKICSELFCDLDGTSQNSEQTRIYGQDISFLLEQNKKLVELNSKINSKDYKIGHFILLPFRYIKRLCLKFQ